MRQIVLHQNILAAGATPETLPPLNPRRKTVSDAQQSRDETANHPVPLLHAAHRSHVSTPPYLNINLSIF
jgi:hypothetical protein